MAVIPHLPIAYERGDAYDLSDYLWTYVKGGVMLMLQIIYDVYILAVLIAVIIRIVKIIRNKEKR